MVVVLFNPNTHKVPPADHFHFFLILFLIFLQILSTFLIQDLFYFLCQQIISEDSAYTLSGNSTSFKPLNPTIQVQFPHVESYDHQVKYHFHCRMVVTVLCMVVRLQLVEPILFNIPPAVHHLP